MDVLATGERCDEAGVGGQVGDAAQLDLVVVGDHQLVAGCGDERLAERPTLLGTHGDVVQVRLVGAEAAGAGDGLVEGGVDPAVGATSARSPSP